MKIQCPNCKTIYNIDDSKIPDKAIFANCPKCQKRFRISEIKQEHVADNTKNNDYSKSKKNTIKGKKFFLIALIAAIVIGSGLAAYNYYSNYISKKILKEAKGFEGIGEYYKAIEAYERYLLKHPESTATKIDFASVLLNAKQTEQAIEVLNKVFFKTKKTEKERTRTYLLLSATYNELATKFKKEAEKALEEENYKLARNNYKKESSYLEKKIGLQFWESINKAANSTDNFNLAFDLLMDSIANISFSYWLEGKYTKAEDTISQYSPEVMYLRPNYQDLVKKRYYYFAYKLKRIGHKAFGRKDFKKARKHVLGALESYKKADSGVAKTEIPRLQLAIAITYIEEANYWKAKKLLTKLQKDFPEFEPATIKSYIKDVKKASIKKLSIDNWNKGEKEFERGNEAFGKKDYIGARGYYREAIKYYKKSGDKNTSLNIAALKYSIAITYWNEGNWRRAREHFYNLKSEHPDYQNETVWDFINRADRIIESQY